MQVREYAILTTNTTALTSPDCGIVSEATLDWLIEVAGAWKRKEPVLWLESSRAIKLGSYVGYLRSPTGESIEILPKTGLGEQNPTESRRILQAMLRSALNLPTREAGPAELLRMDTPIHEWIFGQFLQQLGKLVSRGLCFHYDEVEEESRFVRGQLQLSRQLRQAPGKGHQFHIKHALFTPRRVENRLLKTALDYVRRQAASSENWRLANELSHRLDEIPAIHNPLQALPHWQRSKLLQAYEPVYPWCELILKQFNPNFQQGLHRGIALLFPMEMLFEKHVEACLRRTLASGTRLNAQARSEYLLEHQPASASSKQRWFQLRPDMLLNTRAGSKVLDTKWKLIEQDASDSEHKYGISQGDLYQLYAYGQKYQDGDGHMMLIYPQHKGFDGALPSFCFDSRLSLWCVPFSLESGSLVEGGWLEAFPELAGDEADCVLLRQA